MTDEPEQSGPPDELLHAMRGGHHAQSGRGGCVIHCEVDPKVGAALIAARDKLLRDAFGHLNKEEALRPADPFMLAMVVLNNWADEVWRNGWVAPEHHEEAMRIARARWSEVGKRDDGPAGPTDTLMWESEN